MFCSNCGNNVPDGSRFCPNCGMGFTQGYNQSPTQPPVPVASYSGSAVKTDRSLLTLVLLSLVTCGLYYYWFVYQLSLDANEMCANDGEETPGLGMFILLSFVTCGIYSFWWEYKLGNRLQANAPRYGISLQTSGSDILLWRLLGTLICFVGSYYGSYLLIQSANQLAAAYNRANGLS